MRKIVLQKSEYSEKKGRYGYGTKLHQLVQAIHQKVITFLRFSVSTQN